MIYNKPQRKKGETWVLNDSIKYAPEIVSQIRFQTFNSERETVVTYTKITITVVSSIRKSIEFSGAEGGLPNWYPYSRMGWETGWDRTITFLESPTGDLLAWLQENAVKQ